MDAMDTCGLCGAPGAQQQLARCSHRFHEACLLDYRRRALVPLREGQVVRDCPGCPTCGEVDPQLSTVHRYIDYAKWSFDRYDLAAAEAALREALALQPKSDEARHRLCALLLLTQRGAEAEQLLAGHRLRPATDLCLEFYGVVRRQVREYAARHAVWALAALPRAEDPLVERAVACEPVSALLRQFLQPVPVAEELLHEDPPELPGALVEPTDNGLVLRADVLAVEHALELEDAEEIIQMDEELQAVMADEEADPVEAALALAQDMAARFGGGVEDWLPVAFREFGLDEDDEDWGDHDGAGGDAEGAGDDGAGGDDEGAGDDGAVGDDDGAVGGDEGAGDDGAVGKADEDADEALEAAYEAARPADAAIDAALAAVEQEGIMPQDAAEWQPFRRGDPTAADRNAAAAARATAFLSGEAAMTATVYLLELSRETARLYEHLQQDPALAACRNALADAKCGAIGRSHVLVDPLVHARLAEDARRGALPCEDGHVLVEALRPRHFLVQDRLVGAFAACVEACPSSQRVQEKKRRRLCDVTDELAQLLQHVTLDGRIQVPVAKSLAGSDLARPHAASAPAPSVGSA